MLVNVFNTQSAEASANLQELAELVCSAGGVIVGSLTQRRLGSNGMLLGKGKLEELATLCQNQHVHVVVTQQSLSPLQLKHMEDRLPCRVLDRTGLILDIFAQRARSREGQIQVELAQLLYRLPRLRGHGEELSRLGGGLGTRGPGEQKLEYDRRRIRARLNRLKGEIEKLRQRRGQQRERRRNRSLPSVVLIGYTNAGKSTLFNALTHSQAEAKSHMFSTLDPQVRHVRLPDGGHTLLSDTVGFIRDLPENLRVAFRATLEEITDADAVIHVVDTSHPEAQFHLDTVQQELGILQATTVPQLIVMNKIDAIPSAQWPSLAFSPLVRGEERMGETVWISAKTGEGLGKLLARLENLLRERFWKHLQWCSPTPQIRAELANLDVSTREGAPSNGQPPILEAWLTPMQAARMSHPGT